MKARTVYVIYDYHTGDFLENFYSLSAVDSFMRTMGFKRTPMRDEKGNTIRLWVGK